MDLQTDPAQQQFRHYLRKAFRAHEHPDLVATGVLDINLPIDAGGLELGEASLVIAFEELGAAQLPNTLLGTLLAADCALWTGRPASHRALLAAIRRGELTVAVPDLEDGYPTGAMAWVEPGAGPSHLLLGLDGAGGPAALVLVPAGPAALRRSPHAQHRARVDRSAVTEPVPLVPPERTGDVWPAALRRARLRQAAYLGGVARAAWELTADHVRSRRQFGSALSANQAVAFPMAALAARAQVCGLAVHHAAWAHDTGRDADDVTTGALCLAAELALDTTRLGMHLHGARGLLLASPIQRCYCRAAVEAVRLGQPRTLWRQLGARRLAGLVEAIE